MAFTLLELLVALSILVVAFSIIWGSFSATVTAWRRGSELADDMHHGDFVMNQLVCALRSAAFFSTAPDKYGFRLKDRGGTYPADLLSWVTSGTIFVPEDSPLAQGLHRIVVTVEENDDGEDALAVRAYPHLAEDTEDDDPEPWFISSLVKGIDCRIYDFEEESWTDTWEYTNEVPRVMEVSLYMEPLEDYGDPVILKRLVEIPVAPVVTQGVKWAKSGEGAKGEEKKDQGGGGQPAQGAAGGDGKVTIKAVK